MQGFLQKISAVCTRKGFVTQVAKQAFFSIYVFVLLFSGHAVRAHQGTFDSVETNTEAAKPTESLSIYRIPQLLTRDTLPPSLEQQVQTLLKQTGMDVDAIQEFYEAVAELGFKLMEEGRALYSDGLAEVGAGNIDFTQPLTHDQWLKVRSFFEAVENEQLKILSDTGVAHFVMVDVPRRNDKGKLDARLTETHLAVRITHFKSGHAVLIGDPEVVSLDLPTGQYDAETGNPITRKNPVAKRIIELIWTMAGRNSTETDMRGRNVISLPTRAPISVAPDVTNDIIVRGLEYHEKPAHWNSAAGRIFDPRWISAWMSNFKRGGVPFSKGDKWMAFISTVVQTGLFAVGVVIGDKTLPSLAYGWIALFTALYSLVLKDGIKRETARTRLTHPWLAEVKAFGLTTIPFMLGYALTTWDWGTFGKMVSIYWLLNRLSGKAWRELSQNVEDLGMYGSGKFKSTGIDKKDFHEEAIKWVMRDPIGVFAVLYNPFVAGILQLLFIPIYRNVDAAVLAFNEHKLHPSQRQRVLSDTGPLYRFYKALADAKVDMRVGKVDETLETLARQLRDIFKEVRQNAWKKVTGALGAVKNAALTVGRFAKNTCRSWLEAKPTAPGDRNLYSAPESPPPPGGRKYDY